MGSTPSKGQQATNDCWEKNLPLPGKNPLLGVQCRVVSSENIDTKLTQQAEYLSLFSPLSFSLSLSHTHTLKNEYLKEYNYHIKKFKSSKLKITCIFDMCSPCSSSILFHYVFLNFVLLSHNEHSKNALVLKLSTSKNLEPFSVTCLIRWQVSSGLYFFPPRPISGRKRDIMSINKFVSIDRTLPHCFGRAFQKMSSSVHLKLKQCIQGQYNCLVTMELCQYPQCDNEKLKAMKKQ